MYYVENRELEAMMKRAQLEGLMEETKLSENYKEIMRLTLFPDYMSISDIAVKMSITEKQVYKALENVEISLKNLILKRGYKREIE